jgi:aminodeoxyfutalosine synthase
MAFIPLPFHPEHTRLSDLPPATGFADIKNIAASRLMLDNIPHIKAYWVGVTPRIAQVAQRFGADDMDGTVVEEVISLLSGAGHGQALSKAELVRVIKDAGRLPVERDGLYQTVRRYDDAGPSGAAQSAGQPEAGR